MDYKFEKETGTIKKYLGTKKDVVIPNEIDGVIVEAIGRSAFQNMGLTSVIIPDTVTKIVTFAFYGNELTHIDIPNGVTEIGKYAFENNKLKKVVIPSNVTFIDWEAFENNELTEVIISNGVTKISSRAFAVNKLTSITIPASVVSLGEDVFVANKIVDVTVEGNKTRFHKDWTYFGFTYECMPNVQRYEEMLFYDGTILDYIGNENKVEIPSEINGEKVTTIGIDAFWRKNITSISIPHTITKICAGAFIGNKLVNVKIPNSVKCIEKWVFLDNKLQMIKLPKNLEELGEECIENIDAIISNLDQNVVNYTDEEIIDTLINLYHFTEADKTTIFEILCKYPNFEQRYVELVNHEDKNLKNLGENLLWYIKQDKVISEVLGETEKQQLQFLQKSLDKDKLKKLKQLKLNKLPKLRLKETKKEVDEEIVNACIGAFLYLDFLILPPENKLIELLFDKQDLIKLGECLLKQWIETGMKVKLTSTLILSAYYADDNLINKIRDLINELAALKKFKPMLQMLVVISYNKSKTSLRLLNKVATKGATKGQKQEAKRLLEKAMRLANITYDRLLDMTTLDFGFDDNGVLKLTSGKKSVEVLLEQDFGLAYKLEDGSIIRKLSSNLDKFKKEINALKKEIKSAVSLEGNRLKLAHLKAKKWDSQTFDEVFIQNTLNRQLASGLIFSFDNEDGISQTFTITKGKALETANYEAVNVDNIKEVYLMHCTEATEEVLGSWQQYIKDNELKPLIDQVTIMNWNPELCYNEYEITKYFNQERTVTGLYSKLEKIGFIADTEGVYSIEYTMKLEQYGITAHLNLLTSDYDETTYEFIIKIGNVNFTKAVENKQVNLEIAEVPKRIVIEIINELDNIFK